MDFKRQWGSSIEQDLYGDMDVLQLVDRLLQRRAAAFVGSSDRFLLQDGARGHGGWDSVGTVEETEPLQLRNCLSYDEMKLSSLLSVSSHTVFINDGRRNNKGIETEELESFQRLGAIIGLIGTRLERENVMEYQEIMVTQQQNVEERGYGHLGSSESPAFRWRQMWANFYGAQPNFPLYSEAQEIYNTCKKQGAQRYSKVFAEEYFDNLAYQRRLAVSFETLLLEAESRAEVAGTTAFVHVVGIGLGVWSLSAHQDRQFLDAFGSCVQRLLPVLGRVSDLRFAWFSETEIRGVAHGGRIGHIRVHFSKDEPQMRLKDPRQLLVVSYAWDGNALPGNEFWFGEKTSSGDPAAACCSQVAELHSVKINSRVCANNLRIASPQWGVLHVAEYATRMLSATTSASNAQ